MTVQEAILKIHAPKGVTTVLAGVMSGDYSVLKEHDGLSASLSTAQEMVDKHQKQLNECQSDWAYWGILGDLTYWEAVRNILEAGTLNGGVLADVPGPYLEGLVVMDSIGKVGDFGKEVLSKTKQLVAILYDDTPEKDKHSIRCASYTSEALEKRGHIPGKCDCRPAEKEPQEDQEFKDWIEYGYLQTVYSAEATTKQVEDPARYVFEKITAKFTIIKRS